MISINLYPIISFFNLLFDSWIETNELSICLYFKIYQVFTGIFYVNNSRAILKVLQWASTMVLTLGE